MSRISKKLRLETIYRGPKKQPMRKTIILKFEFEFNFEFSLIIKIVLR